MWVNPVCLVFPLYLPGEDDEALLWLFLYSAYSLHPQRDSLPECEGSVFVTMCTSCHSSVEFRYLTPVIEPLEVSLCRAK